MNITDYINKIEQLRKEQDAIYHNVATGYNLSDTAMWVLYMVSVSEKPCTQQDLCQQCYVAKQTINTAVTGLLRNEIVVLEPIPGTRNQKNIVLTKKGRELANRTIQKLCEAEQTAYGKISAEDLDRYLEITEKITNYLREETEKL